MVNTLGHSAIRNVAKTMSPVIPNINKAVVRSHAIQVKLVCLTIKFSENTVIIRRQRLMYSTRVCSLVNLRGGWVWRGGNPPPPTHLPPPAYPPTPPHPPPPTHPQLASSSTDTFKQRENQNKEKLTKVAAYEL